jgi:hypothetical protein
MIDGVLLLDRAITRHKEWLLEKPFSNGQAMLDLFLLANQAPASFKTQNRVVTIEPGQVGWSVLGLADRWGWSRGKVTRTLSRWEKDGMVKIDIADHVPLITVVNLMDYQSGLRSLLTQLRTTNGQPTDNQQAPDEHPASIEGERGKGVLNCTEGKGKGNRPPETSASAPKSSTAVSGNVAAIERDRRRSALEAAIADIRAKEKDDRDANLPMDMQRRSTLRSLEAQLRGLDA